MFMPNNNSILVGAKSCKKNMCLYDLETRKKIFIPWRNLNLTSSLLVSCKLLSLEYSFVVHIMK